MIHVFLDQNKWIDLARAVHGRALGARFRDARNVLDRAVENRLIKLPLSATHYLETWHRRSWRSRFELAGVMRQFSRYTTIAPIQAVVQAEIERALAALAGRYVSEEWSVFGTGVRHAFGHPLGRFRPVEEIRTDVPPSQLEEVGFDPRLVDMIEANLDKFEWFSLAGPDEDIAFPEDMVDPTGLHRTGAHFAEVQTALGRHIRASGYGHRLRDALILEEMAKLQDDINGAGVRMRVNPDVIRAMGERWPAKFLARLPSHMTMVEMMAIRHQNPAQRWSQHDYADLMMLGAPLAYCDIVVTERQWVDVARRARVDATFGTRVVSDLAAVPKILDELLQERRLTGDA